MKVGDLVKRNSLHNTHHDYGVGILVSRLNKNPFIEYSSDEEVDKRWAVLWTNPVWTLDDGYAVPYEMELEVIGEAG